MTALALRLRKKAAGLRMEVVALALLALAGIAALGITLAVRGEADASTLSVRITPTKAAQLINAALPFAGGPLHSARPFAIAGNATDENRALLCLTQAVYYEAGFEPVDGRRAVAQVVLNRMRHPAFPKSVCGVVYQGANTGVCQFTFVCDG